MTKQAEAEAAVHRAADAVIERVEARRWAEVDRWCAFCATDVAEERGAVWAPNGLSVAHAGCLSDFHNVENIPTESLQTELL